MTKEYRDREEFVSSIINLYIDTLFISVIRLNGYQNSWAYYNLEGKLSYSAWQWNLGIGPASIFTRAISNIMQEAKIKNVGPFDYIIKVDLKQATTTLGSLDIKQKLAIKMGEELGLFRQEDDETGYYSYGQEGAIRSLPDKSISLVPQINQKLIGEKYLLVVEYLYEPVESVAFSMEVGLPPYRWNHRSRWLCPPPPELFMTVARNIMTTLTPYPIVGMK